MFLMENKFEKPSFDIEVKAEIKGISEIENNIEQVRDFAVNLKNYYENVIFTEEDIKLAKEEKSEINKFKKKVQDFKKQILEEYNKPIKQFDDTAKETIKMLTEAYETITLQVSKYEEKLKQEKEEEVKRFFEEYKESKHLGFGTYEQANINLTLSASMKSLKEKAKEFIDKIIDEVELIDTQKYKDEILAEYMKHLNVAKAIKDVTDRHFILEEIQKQKEEVKQIQEQEQKTIEKVNQVVQAPIEEEKTYKLAFTIKIRGTKTYANKKLKELKEFLNSGGYEYE